MDERRAHLVGSLPGGSAAEAMGTAMDLVGPHLSSLPDGETGIRRNWIISIIDGLRSHPDLELAEDGDWSDYDRTPTLKVRRGHRLLGASLDFGHVAAVEASRPAFERICEERTRPDLDFLVGIPGDLDMALFALGPVGGLRHRRAFTEATVAEIAAIHRLLGDTAIFQLEVPAELTALGRLPGPARAGMARLLGRGVAALAAGSPPGARFGLHLCLGDMNHKAYGRLRDTRPLVQLTNAVLAAWPAGRPLEFVHAPLAHADEPPSTAAAFYGPLTGLRLPEHTRFVAGFAHEDQPLAVQRELLATIERYVGRPVDVATSCGLGRRDEAAARRALERTAELCGDATTTT